MYQVPSEMWIKLEIVGVRNVNERRMRLFLVTFLNLWFEKCIILASNAILAMYETYACVHAAEGDERL